MKSGSVLLAAACAIGALGVIAAAGATHGGGGTRLAAAAQILLAHAPAVLGIALAASGDERPTRLLASAGWTMVVGASLFAADMTARHFLAQPLFPMAAPTGGVLLIGAWLLAGFAFLRSRG